MVIFISIFCVIVILVCTCKFKIVINDFQNKPNLNYKIYLEIYLFGILKMFNIKINKKGIKFLGTKIPYDKIDFKNAKIDNIDFLKLIKKLNLKIEKFYFRLNVGSTELMFTVFSVAIISAFLSIFCTQFFTIKKCFYKVNPIYNMDVFEFDLNLIISANVVDVIRFFKNLKKIEKE